MRISNWSSDGCSSVLARPARAPRHEGRPQDDPLGRRTTDDVRVEVARFLGPAAFPGEPEKLRSTATDNPATQEGRDLLSALHETTYESVQDVLAPPGRESLCSRVHLAAGFRHTKPQPISNGRVIQHQHAFTLPHPP